MATKKDTADKAEEKKTPAKKTTAKKTTKLKAPEKKAAPEKEAAEEMKAAIEEDSKEKVKDLSDKILKPEEEAVGQPETPAIIDDSDKILKSSDVELPAADPASKQTIVVSHGKSALKGDEDEPITVISAEEVMKDLEYDFESHEIKPYTGKTMTSHEMHQGKYGIIDDITKPKKK